MFETIDYLQFGNKNQKRAFLAIENLGIIHSLSEYHPILCGTLPIGIDILGSDLDIIMNVVEFTSFEKKVTAFFGNHHDFKLKKTSIRNVPVIKANFTFEGFEFEIFGQPQPVKEQYAYIHMIIENTILNHNPCLKDEVIKLKEQGLKTEPAFCKLLGLEGDPYESLLEFGKSKQII
ncbi:DUF4269 domain-containing protein [Psychrobacillus glaciei]|uniref:DUF4269 domain-containing protein n=1 Tax=Psychrobacillus glaciei TaxID=2283160 RepID=A0A5J6SNS1_9BACI|nr:DUF4269 domain-containing protein [Psychrobacillus glaciei]QFF99113.1 DUF4269 domain-containing protein [Psychrobacillus glaciei]